MGKSNFLFRFVEGKFSQIYQTTVGSDTKSKICTLPKIKKNVKEEANKEIIIDKSKISKYTFY